MRRLLISLGAVTLLACSDPVPAPEPKDDMATVDQGTSQKDMGTTPDDMGTTPRDMGRQSKDMDMMSEDMDVMVPKPDDPASPQAPSPPMALMNMAQGAILTPCPTNWRVVDAVPTGAAAVGTYASCPTTVRRDDVDTVRSVHISESLNSQVTGHRSQARSGAGASEQSQQHVSK